MLNSYSRFMRKLPTSLEMPYLGIGSSSIVPAKQVFGEGMGGPTLDPEQISPSSQNIASPFQLREIKEMEKTIIIGTAISAMDELVKLLQVKEPVWINSPTDGTYLLHRDTYDKIFPKTNHFNTSSFRVESSKDSAVVAMAASNLIEMLLDSVKYDTCPFTITHQLL